MKTKKLYFTILILTANILILSQVEQIDYFGQTPPGDSAIVFAPGIFSLNNRYEYAPFFSPDGKTIYFGVTNAYWNDCKLWYTRYENGSWSEQKQAEIARGMDAWAPTVSPDGKTLYFSSAYPSYPPANIWTCEISGDQLFNKRKLENPFNTTYDEWRASETENKMRVFSSGRQGSLGQQDLYYSLFDGQNYSEPANFGIPVSSSDNDASAFISPDGSYMIFESTRPGGYGQADLVIIFKKDGGGWTNPKNMGPTINSSWIEDQPTVTPDGKYLMFCRREAGYTTIPTNVYWIDAGIINELKETNYSPYRNSNIPDQNTEVGSNYNYTVPGSVFVDDDGNETLTLIANLTNGNELPGWLTFDSNTITFSGTPNTLASYTIKVTAEDQEGLKITDVFTLNVLKAGEKNFLMDGTVDATGSLVSSNNGQSLYTDWDSVNGVLYIATEAASTVDGDVFIFVSKSPDGLTSTPWGKSGSVFNYDAFLGNETDNNWSGWTDHNSTVKNYSGNILEGTINIKEEFGEDFDKIYIAIGVYETNTNGNLINQVPSGNSDGNIDADEFYSLTIVSVSTDKPHIPEQSYLDPNYPNPFNPSTTIQFYLNRAGKTVLKIYDLLGSEVATLIDDELTAGKHSVIYDAENLASGVYLAKLTFGNFTSTRKIILLK